MAETRSSFNHERASNDRDSKHLWLPLCFCVFVVTAGIYTTTFLGLLIYSGLWAQRTGHHCSVGPSHCRPTFAFNMSGNLLLPPFSVSEASKPAKNPFQLSQAPTVPLLFNPLFFPGNSLISRLVLSSWSIC